jgi:3-phosphoshikimate 1-carboxyvinyltransferase
MGVAAGLPFRSRFLADSRVQEGVQPVVDLLQAMGVRVSVSGPVGARMYTVHGVHGVRAARAARPVMSSRVKGAGLFAGMSADGRTTLLESVRTRDHTERMMQYFLVKTLRRGREISIHGGQVPESRDFPVPGDISSAAVWITAAAMQPGADLVVREVGLNESRTVFLKILVRMAAQIGESVKEWRFGEPWGHVTVHGMPLRAVRVTAEESTLVADELPVLAAAAAVADGESSFAVVPGSVAARLMGATAANLERMGVEVRHMGSSWHVRGNAFRGPLRGALLSAGGDHRLALGAAAAALVADGETEIEHADVLEDVYPGFAAMLAKFQTREISMGIEPRAVFPRPELPVVGPGSGSGVTSS